MSQAGALNATGGPTGNVHTLTGNSGGAVAPTNNNINVIGSGVISVVGNPGTSTLTISSSGGSGITTINGDTGSVTGSTVKISGVSTAGPTVSFSGSGTTLALNLTDGNSNLTLGLNSGPVSPSGCVSNVAVGSGCLENLSAGNDNVAVGGNALKALSSGSENAVHGNTACLNLNSGQWNVCMGSATMKSATSGSFNVAIGTTALGNMTGGSYNTVVGNISGDNYTGTESSNVLISNEGVASENNTIRIGAQGTGNGQQNACFVAGIAGVTVSSSGAVLINTSTGQLGTVVSSARYKHHIKDMDSYTQEIMKLRPVSFHYKSDQNMETHFGLIAEEVNEVIPNLVLYDKEGKPESVKYHDLPIFLLAEIQKLKREIESLKRGVK